MSRHTRARAVDLAAALAVVVTLVAAAWPALAALATDGWPQSRRDARRTGLSDERFLADPSVVWFHDTGRTLQGEPIVSGCAVYVADGSGEVTALDREDGRVLWRHARPYAVDPASAASALALDDAPLLLAGLPADPAISQLLAALRVLSIGIDSYLVDFGFYPPGPDLIPDLLPFIGSMPWNPIAGREMRLSATPSPGDYRYERQPSGSSYVIGIWWTDGAFLKATPDCFGPVGPGWPLSPEQGGRRTGLDAGDGSERWIGLDVGPALDLVPAIGPQGAWFTSTEERYPYPWSLPITVGSVRAVTVAGAPRWSSLLWGPVRGGAAIDVQTGSVAVSCGTSRLAASINSTARSLMTAIELYQVDNGFLPAQGELEPVLAPTFLRCWPPRTLGDVPMVWSQAPSPGDYVYEVPSPWRYELAIWDGDGTRTAICRDGQLITPDVDNPPAIEALDAAGARLWRTTTGTPGDDLTPPLLRGDGLVLAGTRSGNAIALDPVTGAEVFRTPLGQALSLAPALLPDGAAVFVSDSGIVFAVEPQGGIRWSRATGAPSLAAPTATSDGHVYVPGSDGSLRAYDAAGTRVLDLPLGGATRAALTTAAVPSHGWLYVGRSDGRLLALASAVTRGLPPDTGNVLRCAKRLPDVVFDWQAAAPSCAHRLRGGTRGQAFPDDPEVATVPPGVPVHPGAVPLPDSLYYQVHALSCCAALEGP